MMKALKMLSPLIIVASFIFVANVAEAGTLPLLKKSVISTKTLRASQYEECDPSKQFCVFIKADNSIQRQVPVNITADIIYSGGEDADTEDFFISYYDYAEVFVDPADFQRYGVKSLSFTINAIDKQPVANCFYKAEGASQLIAGSHTLMLSKLPGGYNCQLLSP